MIGLLDALGRERAIWVGHDWGSPVVWNIASHHPDRCHAVANLCVPYRTLERGLETVTGLVDRDVYPADEFPAGQWEYQHFYLENFEQARRELEANPYNTVKLLFRKGDPRGQGKPSGTAMTVSFDCRMSSSINRPEPAPSTRQYPLPAFESFNSRAVLLVH